MIAKIAYSFVTSAWGRYIILGLAFLAAIAAFGRGQNRAGRKEERTGIIEDVRVHTEEGRNAYHENRRNSAGDGIDASIDRLRGRDDHWGRMPDLR